MQVYRVKNDDDDFFYIQEESQQLTLDFLYRIGYVILIIICLIILSLWQAIIGLQSPALRYKDALPVFKANSENYKCVFPIQTLPDGDYNTLVDLEDFYFQVMDNVCNDSNPLLLVLIHSAPINFENRKAIRETWGQVREDIKIIFMLGNVNNNTLEEKLQRENEIHRDFAQGNFMDTYRNLTYKHVMVLKYVVYHCPQAKYILKTDDDVFVNIERVIEFLIYYMSPYGVRDLLFCKLQQNAEVYRSQRSKWHVSVKEYSNGIYPTYCPGFALMYSPDIVFTLYKEAQRNHYFWIDDVHITGTLAKMANITHTDVSPQFILSRAKVNSILGGNKHHFKFLYGPADLTVAKIRGLWNIGQRHSNKKFKYAIQ